MKRRTLRAAREAAGLTTAQAARIIGRTQSTYSKIERGAVLLDAPALLALSAYFGKSPESLLDLEGFYTLQEFATGWAIKRKKRAADHWAILNVAPFPDQDSALAFCAREFTPARDWLQVAS